MVTLAVGMSGTAHSSERLVKMLAVGGMGLRKNRSSSAWGGGGGGERESTL